MKIKNSNSFDNMGGLIIGEVPISLIVLSALSVALSIFVIILISFICILRLNVIQTTQFCAAKLLLFFDICK